MNSAIKQILITNKHSRNEAARQNEVDRIIRLPYSANAYKSYALDVKYENVSENVRAALNAYISMDSDRSGNTDWSMKPLASTLPW